MSDPDAPALSTREMVDTLAEHKVVYIVIGGIAAAAHGSHRVTRGFDITPQWQDGNLGRLADALVAMGARLRVEGDTPGSRAVVDFPIDGQSLSSFEVSAWRTRHGDLDVVSGAPTRAGNLADYDALLPKARTVRIYGTAVLIAHLDDIIEAKQALRREPDLAALPELYRIQERNRGAAGPEGTRPA